MKRDRLLELAGIADSAEEDQYNEALEKFANLIVDLVQQDTGTANEKQLEQVLELSEKYGRDAAEELIESVNKNAREFVRAWREHHARK